MSDDAMRFAVLAEKKGYARPLYLHGLTLSKLYSDIVIPYEENKPFFVDGVPIQKRDDLDKLKIIRQSERFALDLHRLHNRIKNPTDSNLYTPIADYPGKLLALFQESDSDVTSSIVNAYRKKKGLKVPIDKIVEAASQIAIAAIKASSS